MPTASLDTGWPYKEISAATDLTKSTTAVGLKRCVPYRAQRTYHTAHGGDDDTDDDGKGLRVLQSSPTLGPASSRVLVVHKAVQTPGCG